MNPSRLLLLFFVLMSLSASAQQRAVTDTGDQVVLYKDGTWVYVQKDSLTAEEIPTNNTVFTKNKNATFLLKSKRINTGYWLDPKTWKFTSPADGDVSEFELDHINGSLYGMILTEHLNIPLESLGNIAIQNAREAAPDITVLQKEYRNVNGIKVLMLRMTGTIQDIRFSYFGYYYSTPEGATQFLVYSSEAFMEQNLAEVELLLNGLVQLDE
jgi:hypothetical protein